MKTGEDYPQIPWAQCHNFHTQYDADNFAIYLEETLQEARVVRTHTLFDRPFPTRESLFVPGRESTPVNLYGWTVCYRPLWKVEALENGEELSEEVCRDHLTY